MWAATALAAGLLVAGGAVAPAGAAVDTCGFEDPATDTATTAFMNARDRDGLVGKVENASTKFTQGKCADSVAKLSDHTYKVTPLIAQKKVGADAGNPLLVEAGAGQRLCAGHGRAPTQRPHLSPPPILGVGSVTFGD